VFIQGANTYFHVVIEALDVTVRSTQAESDHLYSRALAPWCYDAGDTLGTIANKNFWSCAINLELRNNTATGIGVANASHWENMARDYPTHMVNFTDAQDTSYAIVRTSDADPAADWSGQSYAISTECQPVRPDSCEWTQEWQYATSEHDPVWSFNCSSAHEGLAGEFRYFSHLTRLEKFHKHLWTNPPFGNRLSKRGRPPPRILGLAKNATLNETQDMFKNPFPWVSQLQFSREDEQSWIDAIDKDNLTFKWRTDVGRTMFVYACDSKGTFDFCEHLHFKVSRTDPATVWDVEYTIIDGKVQHLTPTLSNGSVAGMVSMIASEFVNEMTGPLGNVLDEVNRDVKSLTLAQYTKRYEIEMSKAMLTTLVAFSVPAPVDRILLRVNDVITRLPAVALWLLLSGNALFALLAVVITVCALKSASVDVHQVHLRLSSAGLAAQLFSPESAEQTAKEDSDLFHQRDLEGDSEETLLEGTARVQIHGSTLGGAKFVTISTNGPDSEDQQQRQSLSTGVSMERSLSRQTL
jgi:hypothetical protein